MDAPEPGFEAAPGGRFHRRRGPAHGQDRTPWKLCVAAADRAGLADVLRALADEPSCCFVKYAAAPKAGLFRGRCVLTDPDAVGRLWRRLRDDDRVVVTVQDDAFVARFRG